MPNLSPEELKKRLEQLVSNSAKLHEIECKKKYGYRGRNESRERNEYDRRNGSRERNGYDRRNEYDRRNGFRERNESRGRMNNSHLRKMYAEQPQDEMGQLLNQMKTFNFSSVPYGSAIKSIMGKALNVAGPIIMHNTSKGQPTNTLRGKNAEKSKANMNALLTKLKQYNISSLPFSKTLKSIMGKALKMAAPLISNHINPIQSGPQNTRRVLPKQLRNKNSIYGPLTMNPLRGSQNTRRLNPKPSKPKYITSLNGPQYITSL